MDVNHVLACYTCVLELFCRQEASLNLDDMGEKSELSHMGFNASMGI